MAYSERETLELLGRIADAFWCTFTEEERAKTPDFEREIKEFFEKISADHARISEIESSADGWDRLMVTMLRGRIDVLWKEVIAACEQRGSLANRKYIQFMALIFPAFGITDFPSCQDPEAKLLFELLAHPQIAAN